MSSIYPFSVQGALGHRGAYLGIDLLAGGAEFCWDPFEAYTAGAVTNPNCWILGEPGNGKSALVKSLIWRMSALYGNEADGRWFAIADPKGEYEPLARWLGFDTIRLSPGGTTRLNPLDDLAIDKSESDDRRTLRRAEMVVALVATVLGRSLTQLEDAAVFRAVEHLARGRETPTLGDLASILTDPPADLAEALYRSKSEAAADLSALTFAIEKLLARSLRGMFDGPSTVKLRSSGPGVVIDLSAVPVDSEAMPLVMAATAGWLSQAMVAPGPRRVQVLDEAWALLSNQHTARYLQSCFKLGRTYGIANLCITHRASDLGAQADDGTATAKIATGLLADAATKILLRQAPDQLAGAASNFGLTEPERQIVGQLARGRALWKIADRTAVVQHVLGAVDADLCDTDGRMHGLTPTADVA